MRIFLYIIFILFAGDYASQGYFFSDQLGRYSFDRKIYSEDNRHSGIKPYLIRKEDTLISQNGVWNYANTNDSIKYQLLPVIGFNLQENPVFQSEQDVYSATKIGAQFNASISNKVSTQIRYSYNSGQLSPYVDSSVAKRPYVAGLGLLKDSVQRTYSLGEIDGYISYTPSRYFVFSSGVGKHFFGDGYRSLLLSDFAPTYPYLKMESTFWKVKYVNLLSAHKDFNHPLLSNNKFSASHILSWNVLKWLNLSVFESVVWQGKDSLNNRGFDVNYINPFVFFRPVEYSIGSADNSFFGGSLKVTIKKKHVIYGQLLLDEFNLNKWRNNKNWWANKYAAQIGYRSFDLFKVKGLHFLTEYNFVRPYTYSHMSSLQNYGHLNHSLAHPLESNLRELVTRIGFQKKNIDLLIQYNFQEFGLDSPYRNYGGNMFKSYVDRFNTSDDFEHVVGQGKNVTQHLINARISYMLMPLTNTKFFLEYLYKDSQQGQGFTSALKYSVISFGVSSNLWDSYNDY